MFVLIIFIIIVIRGWEGVGGGGGVKNGRLEVWKARACVLTFCAQQVFISDMYVRNKDWECGKSVKFVMSQPFYALRC